MFIEFVFTIFQANVVAFVLPIITVVLFYLIIPRLRNGSGSRLRGYLSYLITPPRIGFEGSEYAEDDKEPKNAKSWRDDKVRLFFYYIGIILFLSSFVIGEFYEVMFDLLLPVSQGTTGETRVAISVMFESAFSAGWIGSLPWMGVNAYHETWSWIFFTAAFTDNPIFLSTVIYFLSQVSIVVGIVFLLPLSIKRIRHSFFPSMFFFTTGMTIFTKTSLSCLAYAVALAFGNAELDYITLTANGSMIPGLSNIIAVLLPIVLVMLTFFLILGRNLWRVYYSDKRSSAWFMVYIILSFCLGFAITMLLV